MLWDLILVWLPIRPRKYIWTLVLQVKPQLKFHDSCPGNPSELEVWPTPQHPALLYNRFNRCCSLETKDFIFCDAQKHWNRRFLPTDESDERLHILSASNNKTVNRTGSRLLFVYWTHSGWFMALWKQKHSHIQTATLWAERPITAKILLEVEREKNLRQWRRFGP